jgi:hypothetical protein
MTEKRNDMQGNMKFYLLQIFEKFWVILKNKLKTYF